MDSTNHSRVLKLIQELAKTNEITSDEKDQLKGFSFNKINILNEFFFLIRKIDE